MSHFAKLNKDNVVISLIVSTQAEINTENHGDAFRWVQTSYNASFRNKYAQIGDTYDRAKDMFISPQFYDSWILDEETQAWESPFAVPKDGKTYHWDEPTTSWVESKSSD